MPRMRDAQRSARRAARRRVGGACSAVAAAVLDEPRATPALRLRSSANSLGAMSDARSNRQRQLAAKQRKEDEGLLTLSTVIQSLSHTEVTIERRDDVILCGLLEEADAFMNISLSNVVVKRPWAGSQEEMVPLMYVKGTSIRCVQLPDHINAAQVMRNRVRNACSGCVMGIAILHIIAPALTFWDDFSISDCAFYLRS
eukprot:2821113-Pleurochrysis_carterae.AAC.7